MITNEKGFTLTEVLITGLITVVMTLAVAEITIATVKAMMLGGRQVYSQASAEFALNQIASDLRNAGSNDLEHILTGSGKTSVMIRMFNRDLDEFDPSETGNTDDIMCYRFRAPNGSNQFDPNYIPGNLVGGSMSGSDSETSCLNWFPLTDQYTDVRSFAIEYCRPAAGSSPTDYGSYDCTTANINNGNLLSYLQDTPNVDLSSSAACVWMVKLSVTYSRMHLKYGATINSEVYNNYVNTYQTAVMLRNPYIMSILKDNDNDGRVDCCDPDYGMDDTAWCPDAQSS